MGVAAVFVCLLLALAAKPTTQPQPVVVELFTSEGCSSCPPADRLLMELDRHQPVPGANIIVLSEHIDYWNGLGWSDPYSSHQWSQRQDAYARRFGLDSVYTPQMIIDGEHQVSGNDPDAVRQKIELSASRPKLPIEISSITREGDALQVTFMADAAPNATLFAVLADDSDHSTVVRGENAGRSLDHVAVVRTLTPIASLQTTPTKKMVEIRVSSETAKQHLRLILFAQDGKNGRILGASVREL
jgi:hypothetical protein